MSCSHNFSAGLFSLNKKKILSAPVRLRSMISKSRFLSIYILLMILAVLSLFQVNGEITGSSQTNNSASSDESVIPVNPDILPESLFDIRIVSPDMIQQIEGNMEPGDQILKAGPGVVIGVSTSKALYLRADLSDEDLLTVNREGTDLKKIISQHMIDITFGKDNSNLTLFKSDSKYRIWFDSGYTDEDINTVISFARVFNNLSSTAKLDDEEIMLGDLKDNYQKISYHYFNIRIVPKTSLEDFHNTKNQRHKKTTDKDIDEGGSNIGILSSDYLYLWDGLSPDKRDYYIKKGLLWSMGFHGESQSDSDSFFSKTTNYSANLSELDKEAVRLLYGGKLTSGMTLEQVKKHLNIPVDSKDQSA